MKKKVEAIRNSANGIDLVTERDAGNEIRILTGNPKNSLAYWRRLRQLCDSVINEFEERKNHPNVKVNSIEILHP
ncbi:MAG TPA: hypothetical protein VGZ90_13585 [Puia sp.]|jgi:hypothetical protein|nr:hypothetical protein [Puia sp.]